MLSESRIPKSYSEQLVKTLINYLKCSTRVDIILIFFGRIAVVIS